MRYSDRVLSRLRRTFGKDNSKFNKQQPKTKRAAIKNAFKSLRQILPPSYKDTTKEASTQCSGSDSLDAMNNHAATDLQSTAATNARHKSIDACHQNYNTSLLPAAQRHTPVDCIRTRNKRNQKLVSTTRLIPASLQETTNEDYIPTSRIEEDEANAIFFDSVSASCSATDSNKHQSPETTSSHLASASVPRELLRQVRDRDEQLNILRHCNNGQQRELTSLRKLVKIYIEKERHSAASAVQWQHTNERALALADQWKYEADVQTADNAALGVQLAAARCGEDIAREAYEAFKADCEARHSEGQTNLLTARVFDLLEENEQLTRELDAVRTDYEILAEHQAAKCIANPTGTEASSIELGKVRDLEQTLEQSMHNHKAEVARCNEACKIIQEQQTEINRLMTEMEILQQQITDLQKLDSARTITEDHLSAVKTLFAASSLLHSESDLVEAIEELVQELTKEKVSSEMIGSLMRQVAEMRTEKQVKQRNHEELLLLKEAELKHLKRKHHDLETNQIETAIRLSEAESKLDGAEHHIRGLEEDRIHWLQQCEKKAFDHLGAARYDSINQRGDLYRNKPADSYRPVQLPQTNSYDMRCWAADELDATTNDIELRHWYKAQARPRGELAKESTQVIEDGQQPHRAKHQRADNVRSVQLPGNPLDWAVVMPQLPAGSAVATGGTVDGTELEQREWRRMGLVAAGSRIQKRVRNSASACSRLATRLSNVVRSGSSSKYRPANAKCVPS